MPATRRGNLPREEYERMGVALSKKMDTIMTLHEIAQRLGMTDEGARKVCAVALGKLVHRLRREYNGIA
jgi:DNA-directed RNA polymerase sigma subunit (sigma70/sigma32)